MDAFANVIVGWHPAEANRGIDLGFAWVVVGSGWLGLGRTPPPHKPESNASKIVLWPIRFI
jgi:hypothetical protein